MNMTKKHLSRMAALAAAAVITAGVPLTMQRGAASKNQFTALAYSATDTNYTQGSTGQLNYAKYSDHIEILGCASGAASVEIPETIENLPVTAIARYAFQCSSLKSITLPESIKTIGYYAFDMSNDLTTVNLPDSLELIEMNAFKQCKKLENVTFPSHFVEIHSNCFDETPWMDAQRKKDPLVIINGALIDGKTAEGKVEVPSNVKYVSSSAFARNNKLTSIVFHSNIDKVSDNTFFYCENLTSAEFKGITSIESMAFAYCNRLTDLKISGKLSKIEDYAFSDISNSATITFYGSKDKWEQIDKANNTQFFQNAKMIFDESHVEDVKGDVNMDGSFNISDLVLVQKWLLADKNTVLKNWKAADFNSDNVLDSFDLVLMRRGLIK